MLAIELSAGDKAANGTKEISVSLSYNSQPLGLAPHPHPCCGKDRGGSSGSGESGLRPATLKAGAEKSVTSAPRGQDREGPESEPTEGKKPRLRSAAGELPCLLPSLVSHS